jgi:fumarate reductase subunit D
MLSSEIAIRIPVFIAGLTLVVLTLYSALSTFVLPRSARSLITRVIFTRLRAVFDFLLRFTKTYRRRDAIMAYYAPIGLMPLLPAWYLLIALGYTAIYWALDAGDLITSFELSGSSLFTLGVVDPHGLAQNAWAFSESMLGLLLVAVLIAYLPAMYAAFSRREQAVNMLEVRAGTPPSAVEMLLRFNRIHGLDKLGDYWRSWEAWFADIEESHTTLAAVVFFRSPRP